MVKKSKETGESLTAFALVLSTIEKQVTNRPPRKPGTKREPLADITVGSVTGVDGNPMDVTIGERIQLDTMLVPAGDGRQAFLQAKIEAAIKSALAKVVYLSNRDVLELSQTDRNFLVLKGTGTKRDAIWSKKQFLAFCERAAEFKAQAQGMPDSAPSEE